MVKHKKRKFKWYKSIGGWIGAIIGFIYGIINLIGAFGLQFGQLPNPILYFPLWLSIQIHNSFFGINTSYGSSIYSIVIIGILEGFIVGYLIQLGVRKLK